MWLTDTGASTAAGWTPEAGPLPEPNNSQPTATTSSSDAQLTPATVSAAPAKDIKRPSLINKKRSSTKTGDDSLFDSWLSSEIEKNQAKIAKMSAEKELIELKKIKTTLEIQNLQSTVFHSVSLLGSEL